MLYRTALKVGLAALMVLQTSGGYAQHQDILGKWKGPGGEITVEPCASSQSLCVIATGGDGSKDSMASIIGQTVVKDMVSVKPGRWRGTYIADGKNLVANVTVKRPGVAEMRVCLFSWFPYLFCETPTYTKVP